MTVMNGDYHPLQKRIDYKDSLSGLLTQVINNYNLGVYLKHQVVDIGYEDFNLILETNQGKYFIKFLSSDRSDKKCQRYVNIMLAALNQGVNHPKLFTSSTNHYLDRIKLDKTFVRFIVMEYVEGDTFFDLKRKPNDLERKQIIEQTMLINNINLNPDFIYDEWAIVNFLSEYKKTKKYLNKDDKSMIDLVAKSFSSVNLSSLPHCFVHGDIIDTNVLRANNGKIYILDFSVANVYPRIQELAVLLCDIFFNNNQNTFKRIYDDVLNLYQTKIKLEELEIKTLPIFIQIAHAMHIIGATRTSIEGGNSTENDYWLKLGRKGLSLTLNWWS